MAMSSPGVYPALSIASTSIPTASSLLQVGGEPALVADRRSTACVVEQALERLVRLDPPAQALGEVGAPIGMIMNS